MHLVSVSRGTVILVSVVAGLYIPPALCAAPALSTSLSTFVAISFLKDSHSDWSEMEPRY